ncbi:Lrp/AsnC family transcriptional regulator [uncultured Brevundimonas sp.]|uniref:Lrp/AsnC family transcriptional regulator n=1 Tax=uncultured Brevundimonas sp. TaxID=213418 RepID=UPI0030ED30F5|tara:strand:+ start:1471 stop:1938 length:468 start_codon:yes stop_codon:yes gene_type:complete
MRPHKLDEIDQRLLRMLQRHGRRSNVDLARDLGVSPSACSRRIRLLESRGVIRGYQAVLGAAAPETPLVALVSVTLEKQTEEFMRRFEAAVRHHPEIEECYLMTGGSDYVLKVSSADTKAYEAIHSTVLSRLPGVARLTSSFALRDVAKTTGSDR